MLKPPSLVRDYTLHYSGDPALKQAPEAPVFPEDMTEESKASVLEAFKKEHAEYVVTLKTCQQTGDWSLLVLPGQQPTPFVMTQVNREDWRALAYRADLPRDNPRHIGWGVLLSLLFRMSIKSITGWGSQFDREPGVDGWVMAPTKLVTALDDLDPGIVTELGAAVLSRLRGESPL